MVRPAALCDDRPVCATVLVVDDHADFRESAGALLQAAGFAVVGVAAGGLEAIDAVRRLRPDIVVLDIQLPDLDGFAVAERLAAEPDPPAVVLISSRDAGTYGSRLAGARVRGFIAPGSRSAAARRSGRDAPRRQQLRSGGRP